MRAMKKVSSLLVFFLISALVSSLMAEEETGKPVDGTAAAVHIVYVEQPEGEDPEAFHVRTLASVVGSEAAAREALIYSYKHAASGFSAKLTPQQVAELSKQPGVLQVVPSRTLQLHSGPGRRRRTVGAV